ncbi:MAG: VOC family protein, partial [Deltaproteobacteria bacterium]|nr:VOC family protein [Deltaproteobacteria bacterium]
MINAFQHIGMGVWDIDKTFSFYKDLLGFKVKLNDITLAPKEMEPVLGKVETMRVMMALNVKGGGAVEFVEYKSTPIGPLPEDCGYGNYGVLEIGIGVCFIEKVVEYLESRGVGFLTPVCSLDLASGIRWKYAYLLDPNGLRIQLVEDIRPGDEKPKKPEIQGVVHVGLGVSDM